MRVITGKAKGALLKSPDGQLTRPTADRVKEALFSIIQFDIPAANVLDLFGGTGQLAIEALSRGAKHAVIVDSREEACKVIRENLHITKFFSQADVIRADYLQYLKNCTNQFRIIFLDPPYAEKFLENSLKMITEIDILETGGIIVAERPLGKELLCEFQGYTRSRDYKYGKTIITIYQKE